MRAVRWYMQMPRSHKKSGRGLLALPAHNDGAVGVVKHVIAHAA